MTNLQCISKDKHDIISNHIDWIDVVKGINIVCVIIGHLFGCSKVFELIYSFHMPLFFILSGYTIKKINISDLPKATIKDFKRLYCPLFITTFLGCLLQGLIFIVFNKGSFPILSGTIFATLLGNQTLKGSSYYISYLWFLVALFWSKFFYRLILLKIENNRTIILFKLSYIISISINFYLPLCLDLIFLIMFYMDIGYLLKEKETSIIKHDNYIDIIVAFIWLYFVSEKHVFVDLATRNYSILGIVVSLMGSFTIIQISKGINCTRFLKNIFKYLGKHSLLILCIHYLQKLIVMIFLGI